MYLLILSICVGGRFCSNVPIIVYPFKYQTQKACEAVIKQKPENLNYIYTCTPVAE